MKQEQVEMTFDDKLFKERDRNRELMIKYKYDRISHSELNQLEASLSKLIYKIIHRNNIYLETKDIYQEVWLKIAKSKNTWNEAIGTHVSTWIGLVCQSVCNTLRHRFVRHIDRITSYDGMILEDSGRSAEDFISGINFLEDSTALDKVISGDIWKKFILSLDPMEKSIIDIIASTTVADLEKVNGKGCCTSKITKVYLRRVLDLSECQLNKFLKSLKKKYYEVYEGVA